ncbi:hypothetical protein C0J52_25903 [Blattella germanica]|nr:hypothetical protein C0J52_25903 [Blattella germanica]
MCVCVFGDIWGTKCQLSDALGVLGPGQDTREDDVTYSMPSSATLAETCHDTSASAGRLSAPFSASCCLRFILYCQEDRKWLVRSQKTLMHHTRNQRMMIKSNLNSKLFNYNFLSPFPQLLHQPYKPEHNPIHTTVGALHEIGTSPGGLILEDADDDDDDDDDDEK